MIERGGREGRQIGNYRFVRLLGHGGFADVYLGEHLYLKTPVAIKLLQARVIDKTMREDFLREAQTIAHLVHPHIVRVLDFGVERKTPFLVMEYAPNGTLRQRHPLGSILPLTTIVSYARQITEALDYAHDKGIIHRDVKPENMLLGRDDELLLSDFGVATAVQRSQTSATTQEVAGTMNYMAPEQIQGRPVPATDQYALGAVVYEWLSGTPPFYGISADAQRRNLAPALSEKVPTIAPAIEQVVMKALATEPEQRFPTTHAFAEALEVACEEPSLGATPSKSISVPLERLAPTVRVPSPSREQPRTEKAFQFNTLYPQQTEVATPRQIAQTVRTSNSAMRRYPTTSRFQIVFIVGSIAGLLGALIQMVLALWNDSVLQQASKQLAQNKLTVPAALAVIGVDSINILIGLLASFIAGMIAGKITARRWVGSFTAVIAGATLYLVTFFVSYLPQYPINTTARGLGAGLVGGSLILSLVFLCLWALISGFIGFLGAGITTRK